MPYRVSRSVNVVEDDDDTLSQCSKAPESDDRELEMYAKAVAEFKVTWQKQRREKEKKFLKAAQAEIDAHIDRKKELVEKIVNDMEDSYQDFLSKYAVIEDKQREVIVQISDALKTLVSLSVRKHQETVEITDDLEVAQVEGIKQIKQTCRDFAGLVEAFKEI